MVKYKVKVNTAGLIFIAITILLGVSAINTGNNLLYLVVSSLLSFMILSGVTALYNLKGLKLVLIPPREVFAGKRENFKILLENRYRFPKFLLTFEYLNARVTVPVLLGSKEVLLPMVFDRRGLVKKVTITVKTDFPVGLFTRYYTQELDTSFVVFPKPVFSDVRLFLDRGKERQQYTENVTNMKGYDEIVGTKEYSGEATKLINWKATAKVGKLMAKEMYASAQSPVILSLEQVEGDLETKISKLTYIAIELLEKGYPVGLRLGNQQLDPSTGEIQRYKILKALALFHQSPGV